MPVALARILCSRPLAVLAAASLSFSLRAGPAEDYEKEVQPLLKKHCLQMPQCGKAEGELDLVFFTLPAGGRSQRHLAPGPRARSSLRKCLRKANRAWISARTEKSRLAARAAETGKARLRSKSRPTGPRVSIAAT